MNLRRKRYRAECKRCKCLRKMEMIGSSDDQRYLWLRCSSCHMVFLYPVECFSDEALVLSPLDLMGLTECSYHTVVEYSLNKTYALGQHIYHKSFNDVGEVISKRKLTNGSRIVVVFKRCGEKTLVEGLRPA